MATSRPAAVRAASPASGKRAFANRAAAFVKRVHALPGARFLWPVSFAVAVLMIVTGGFNSSAIPIPQRIGFWALLFGWNALKWQTWFALTIRTPQDWPRASLIGAVLICAPLPLEIRVALHAIGFRAAIDSGGVWLRTAVISASIFPVIWLVARGYGRWAAPVRPPAPTLLARARTTPETLAAIEAEDHYCRVRRRDGSSTLLHYRFGDALAELGELDGLQVHRGAWVAAGAVTGAAREGRRWLLTLSDGCRVPVSATHLAAVRARGWLSR